MILIIKCLESRRRSANIYVVSRSPTAVAAVFYIQDTCDLLTEFSKSNSRNPFCVTRRRRGSFIVIQLMLLSRGSVFIIELTLQRCHSGDRRVPRGSSARCRCHRLQRGDAMIGDRDQHLFSSRQISHLKTEVYLLLTNGMCHCSLFDLNG